MAKLVAYKNTMPKNPKPKGKVVKGKNFAAADEVYDKKTRIKEDLSKSTAGLEKLFKKAQKETAYSNKPRVKPQKKVK